MSKWHENPEAVSLMEVLNREQCYDRLPYPPYGDLMFTDEHFANRVEEVIPDKVKRVRAIKTLYNATTNFSAQEQFKTYLEDCGVIAA